MGFHDSFGDDAWASWSTGPRISYDRSSLDRPSLHLPDSARQRLDRLSMNPARNEGGQGSNPVPAKPTPTGRGRLASRHEEVDPNEFVDEEPQPELKQPRRHLLTLKIPKGKNFSEPSSAITDNGESRPSTASSEESWHTGKMPPTDSGYASAPNLDRYSHAKSSTAQARSPASNKSPAAMNDIDIDDTRTLYSAGTTAAPSRVQIAEICSDIYSKLSDCLNAKTWPIVAKVLPDLVKAFAVKLGSDSTAQVNQDVMYFVHKRHKEVVARIEAMFRHDIDDQPEDRRDIPEGMPLLDKMAMWQSKVGEDHTHATESDDCFKGVKDYESDPIEEINLPEYHKVIFDSEAYKWFLTSFRKEVILQWGASHSRIMTESIRCKLLEKLPTGTISWRHAPSSHEVTFVLHWHQNMQLRLGRENIELPSWPAHSFSSFVVLTGSPEEAQALTMKQYMNQTWPTNGLQIFNLLQEAISSPNSLYSAGSPPNAPIVARVFGSKLTVTAAGPAYFIAECGEQLAWLASALASSTRDVIAHCTPSVANFDIRATPPPNSTYRGKCDVILEITHVASLDGSRPREQNSWEAVVRGNNLIKGYPISRRPEGFPGLELSLDILLYLMQAKEVCISGGHVLIRGPERTLKLVKQTDKVCLWHPLDTVTRGCFCNQLPTRVDISNLETDRHVLGSCERQDARPENADRVSTIAGSSEDMVPEDYGVAGISHLDAAGSESQRLAAFRRNEADSVLHGSRSGEMVRRWSTSRGVEYPISEDCLPTSQMGLSESNGDFPSVVASESGDDSFDTDQLSISDSSEDIKPLDANEPLYPILNHVLHQLLSGFRSWTQHPSCASGSGSGSGTSASALGLSSSSAGGTPSQSRPKRKRGKDDSDDADQNGFRRPPKKKSNCDPGDASKKSFACPYLKKDPIKHGSCCAKKLSRIRDVKQHLARRHTPERYCQRCLETTFADEQSLQVHIDLRICLSRDPSMLEGISYYQHRQLSRKSDSSLGEEGQWFAIWEILFSGRMKPSSPYIDAGFSVEMRLFREYSYSRGPAMVREQIELSTDFLRQDITEAQRLALDRVIAEGISRLFEDWRSAQPAGSLSSRHQSNYFQRTGQGTPMTSVADSGVAMGSQFSSSGEVRSQGGITQSSSMLELTFPPTATTTGVEIQASSTAQDVAVELSQNHEQDWLALLSNPDNLEYHLGAGNEHNFDHAFNPGVLDFDPPQTSLGGVGYYSQPGENKGPDMESRRDLYLL
ncbi:hypothetical protein BGZ61DRAFT_535130 [Ilyonectria robusta]|uniref:uncharacterized protein n=1 Tax=Ilyonectria robusta TaxID=1079257 RepID=UPI001E8CEC16|nr:uncharacterized protein BGZ61DRAFT_535130 [Ilyonectria robusta]KAH8683709.1 hypothetical protein BGZ61DRAFT_535130 [Ilyonectria robusta]